MLAPPSLTAILLTFALLGFDPPAESKPASGAPNSEESIDSEESTEQVVPMESFEGSRPAANFFARAIGQQDKLVARGRVEVDGKSFDVYLPHPLTGYQAKNTFPGGTFYNSTAIGVDHDGDGQLSPSENFHAHRGVRIGDVMFDVTEIAADGSQLKLRKRSQTPTVLVRGAHSDELTVEATHGASYRVGDFRGKALLFKFWSPT